MRTKINHIVISYNPENCNPLTEIEFLIPLNFDVLSYVLLDIKDRYKTGYFSFMFRDLDNQVGFTRSLTITAINKVDIKSLINFFNEAYHDVTSFTKRNEFK